MLGKLWRERNTLLIKFNRINQQQETKGNITKDKVITKQSRKRGGQKRGGRLPRY